MSLIDDTYFINEIALPEGKYKPIQGFISRYEPRIIFDLFGLELGTLILNYDENTSEQRIKDIVTGMEYEVPNDDCGYFNPSGLLVKIKWNGLINTDKISVIAFWVFYWYCRENDLGRPVGLGGAKPKLENADNVGFNESSTYAWNQFALLAGNEYQSRIVPSVYNFMYEHKDVYPEWIMRQFSSINQFGI